MTFLYFPISERLSGIFPKEFQTISEKAQSDAYLGAENCHRTDKTRKTFIYNGPVRAKTLSKRC